MRFLISGLGLNIALWGVLVPQLAVAAPIPPLTESQASGDGLTIIETEGTLIRGNGVEFTAPTGFQGGSPSSSQVKEIVRETARLFPSFSSFIETIDRPGVLRALAIDVSATNIGAVLVQRIAIPAEISLADLHQAMATTLPTMLPTNVKVVDSQVVTIGDRQLIKIEIEAKVGGMSVNETMALVKEGNEMFQVVYAFDRQNAVRARQDFDLIMRTFRAIPTARVISPVI